MGYSLDVEAKVFPQPKRTSKTPRQTGRRMSEAPPFNIRRFISYAIAEWFMAGNGIFVGCRRERHPPTEADDTNSPQEKVGGCWRFPPSTSADLRFRA
jgi:hypothetical protein